ncbi:MAG TPA: hypothetical protein VFJ62_02795 [Usitatibacter sp.]|nr:hypothetical protein [Usitatibacter sp.]
MAIRTAHAREAWVDFAELVAKAFFGGLGVAIAMAVAIILLSPGTVAASAAPPDAGKAAVSK